MLKVCDKNLIEPNAELTLFNVNSKDTKTTSNTKRLRRCVGVCMCGRITRVIIHVKVHKTPS